MTINDITGDKLRSRHRNRLLEEYKMEEIKQHVELDLCEASLEDAFALLGGGDNKDIKSSIIIHVHPCQLFSAIRDSNVLSNMVNVNVKAVNTYSNNQWRIEYDNKFIMSIGA